MNIEIKGKRFLVCGAGSGFGKAVALQLAGEGAEVLAVSRTESKLLELQSRFPRNISILTGDLFDLDFHNTLINKLSGVPLSGALINAGGPPAGGFSDFTLNDWDNAWNSVVKWKIALTEKLLEIMKPQHYGRLLYIESVSVLQPVDNLILSNALRPAVVGFVKTVAKQMAPYGITLNVLAPGYHRTAALERLFKKKAETEGISEDEAGQQFEKEIPVGKMASPEEAATLAAWLLSPLSRYVTGEVLPHDGGIRL